MDSSRLFFVPECKRGGRCNIPHPPAAAVAAVGCGAPPCDDRLRRRVAPDERGRATIQCNSLESNGTVKVGSRCFDGTATLIRAKLDHWID